VSCLLLVAVACGPAFNKSDPLTALTGSAQSVDVSTLPDSDPRKALHAIDGISLVAPILIETGVPLDPTTVLAGHSVRVFEFTTGFPPEYVGELSAAEFEASASGSLVRILPLAPLAPRTCYVVVLTRTIRDAGGLWLKPGPQARTQPGFLGAHLAKLARQANLPLSQVARVRSYKTQSVREVLAAVYDATIARPVQLVYTGLSTGALGLPAGADIYVGTIEVPMYLDPLNPLNSSWRSADGKHVDASNPMPAQQAVLAIPVIMTVPNVASGQAKPDDGWDMVIYQHGITRIRTDMLSLAGSMAQGGQAMIAIDLPMHGITDGTNPFFQPGRERTFDLDVVNNVTLYPVPDGVTDDSGTHFINLQNLLTFRDNGRQAVSDLFTLTRSIPEIDYDGGGADFDGEDIRFVGMSLGGIAATSYVALEDGIDAAAFGMVGGGVARLLQWSPYGALVDGTLAAQGIFPGTAQYEFYYDAMQTVVDGGDPVNFAREAASKHPIHLMQMRNDPVVPNAVAGWPLSGSEAFANLMGLTPITTPVYDPAGVRGFVTFTDDFGISHQPHLEPGISPRVTVEMVSSMVTFFASGGALLPVSDPGAIE
jgi:hypothetical protein